MLIHEREISLEKKEIMKESEIERIRHYYSLLKDKPYSIQQIARRKRKLIVPKEGMQIQELDQMAVIFLMRLWN